MPVFKTGAINRSATSPQSLGPLRLYVEFVLTNRIGPPRIRQARAQKSPGAVPRGYGCGSTETSTPEAASLSWKICSVAFLKSSCLA